MGKWAWMIVASWIGLEALAIACLGFAWQWRQRRAATEARQPESPAPRVPARAA